MSPLALITGGQQGIGLAIARQLHLAGFRLALAAEHAPDHPAVNAALEIFDEGAQYFQHDVSKVEDVSALLDTIEAAMGPISTFVSNAGVGAPQRGDMLDITPESWDFVHDINLRGGFFLAQEVARRMLKQDDEPYRSIIFITSVSAQMVSINRAEYCVSKAGAGMMSKLFSVRLAPHGIGVFDLRPGIISTELTAGVRDKYTPQIEDGLVPAKRWGEPQDIGQIAALIATGQMRFANGASIPVDGGLSIPRF